MAINAALTNQPARFSHDDIRERYLSGLMSRTQMSAVEELHKRGKIDLTPRHRLQGRVGEIQEEERPGAMLRGSLPTTGISHGNPFYTQKEVSRLRAQNLKERQWEETYGGSTQGLEQPWIDPVEALAGGLASIPRGLASVGMEMALDPLLGFGLERAFEGDDGSLSAMAGGKRGISKLARNPGSLIVQHNLSQSNLAHAEKMGGIPVPSLAITKADDALTNFGDISLIGNKELIDPRGGTGAKVYGADVYSPRYPSIDYQVSRKSGEALRERLGKYEEKVGGTWSSYPDIADRGRDAVEQSPLVMAEFLDAIGEKIPVKKGGRYGSPKEINGSATRDAMEQKIRKKFGVSFQEHVDSVMDDVVEKEQIFQGYTPSGNRRYKSHTLENVTKEMKQNIRGGENFNYGPGSLRAMFTPEFKSLKQIKDNEGKLVSASTFEGMKDDLSNELSSLYEDMLPFMKYQNDNSFGNYDTFVEQLSDISGKGIRGMMEEYFPGAPTEGVKNLITKMGDFPTEYFEANILRSVGIEEFSAAVVPTGTPQNVIDRLRKRGLQIKKYKKGDDSARKSAISKLNSLRFSVLPASMLSAASEEESNTTSGLYGLGGLR